MLPWFQYTSFGPIKVWGFFVALGMVVSLLIIWVRAKKLGLDQNKILDQVIWLIVGGLIFARIFHIIFYEPIFYFNNPVEILKIWQGGLSSFGGLFGAVLGFVVFWKWKKLNKKNLLKIIDLLSFSALYGWIIGRLGCFMIHDHLGTKSDVWFALQTPDGSRLEMAMLEIIGLIPLAILFFIFRNKKLKAGWFLSVLFIYYGVLRFVLDFFRAVDISQADARYFGLTPGQYFAIVLVVFGLFLVKKGRIA